MLKFHKHELIAFSFYTKTVTPILEKKTDPPVVPQVKLPGSKFGTIKPSDLPKTNLSTKLEADIEKREAVKEAFEVRDR